MNQTTYKYIEGAKRVCKVFSDATFSTIEFERAMNQVANLSRTKGIEIPWPENEKLY